MRPTYTPSGVVLVVLPWLGSELSSTPPVSRLSARAPQDLSRRLFLTGYFNSPQLP